MNTYEVIRYVKEYYEVEADSRKEALDNAENPCAVEIRKETCKKIKQ